MSSSFVWELGNTYLTAFGSYSFPGLAESHHFKCNFLRDMFFWQSLYSLTPVTIILFNENLLFSLEGILTICDDVYFGVITWLMNLSKINVWWGSRVN